jgi:hypothetical protein
VEFIPVLIGLFLMFGWTFGILTRQEFATIPNRNIVIWWWLSFAVIFVADDSFWNLLWLMPTTALLNVFTAISIRGFFGFLVGGIPTLILFILMDF